MKLKEFERDNIEHFLKLCQDIEDKEVYRVLYLRDYGTSIVYKRGDIYIKVNNEYRFWNHFEVDNINKLDLESYPKKERLEETFNQVIEIISRRAKYVNKEGEKLWLEF